MLIVHQALPKLQQSSEPKAPTSVKGVRANDNFAFAHRSKYEAPLDPLGSGSCLLPFTFAEQDIAKLIQTTTVQTESTFHEIMPDRAGTG